MKRLIVASVMYSACVAGAFGYVPIDRATLSALQDIEQKLLMYQLEQKELPSQEEGLNALVTAGYCKEILRDSWNQEFVYVAEGINNSNGFDLYSFGEDGISKSGGNDADDINNWDKSRSWETHYRKGKLPPATYAIGTAVIIFTTLGIFIMRKRTQSNEVQNA